MKVKIIVDLLFTIFTKLRADLVITDYLMEISEPENCRFHNVDFLSDLLRTNYTTVVVSLSVRSQQFQREISAIRTLL